MKYTVGSLFSGIGGIDLAFQQSGFQIVYQVEIDEYCRQVLKKHWTTVTRYGDIFTIDALPAVDVMAGGFPCQPVSNAGQRRGEEDERWLWPEFLRLIRQSRPRMVFLENVPGLRTIDSGNTFRSILRELAESGYDAQWAHLRASDAGAPHRRERVFIVAYTCEIRRDAGRTEQSLQGVGKHSKTWGNDVAYCKNTGIDWRQRVETDDAAGGSTNGQNQRIRSNGGYKALGNATLQRMERMRTARVSQFSTLGEKRIPDSTGQNRHRSVKSRLGRVSHGLPVRLDNHRFPAPPGEPYDWEPSRTTEVKTNRAARLQALGNAVVPQCVYPVALAIREWLEGTK